MSLARRIRDCRYAKGWGPDELAGRAEISRTALYQIESGKTETPRAGTLRRIATALGVTIETLLGHELMAYRNQGQEEPFERVEQELERLATTSPTASAGHPRARDATVGGKRSPIPALPGRDRGDELDRKFHELLASPLGESLARIIEESHRLLPTHGDKGAGT